MIYHLNVSDRTIHLGQLTIFSKKNSNYIENLRIFADNKCFLTISINN